jgi:hypothetical protein
MHPKEISTVTKSIKIYSNNPIHVAIANVIDACEIFEGEGDPFDLAMQLHQATDDLNDIAFCHRIEQLNQLRTKDRGDMLTADDYPECAE